MSFTVSGSGQRKEGWGISPAVGLGAAAVTAFIAARGAGAAAGSALSAFIAARIAGPAAGIGVLVILGGKASQYLNKREPSKKD